MPTIAKAGGPVEGVVISFQPASTWSDPAVGDLVKITTGANYEVSECADSDVPAGILRVVSPDKKMLAVELFSAGSIARLPYTATPSLGQQVQASAATTVKGVASGGVGKIVALSLIHISEPTRPY